jgi:SRSO17 transposase
MNFASVHLAKEPAMPLSCLPALLASCFLRLAAGLDRRSAARLPRLLLGILLAHGRRTVTSWFRAAGITDQFRRGYATVRASGRRTDHLAVSVLQAVEPLLPGQRLLVAIDDTPTPRWGPCVEGAGIHHNPNPGPAGEKFVYGHVWVTLAALAKHPDWGTRALPLQSKLYVRQQDLAQRKTDRRTPFHTKLELAAEQLHWLQIRARSRFASLWAVVDGAYAKRPVLRAAQREGIVLVGRLAKNAALWCLPGPKPEGRRGPPATYGKKRIELAKRAGQQRGWQQVTCRQYGQEVVKTIKTFLATWHPAGGVIRVVLVQEKDKWLAYFGTDPEATVAEILEAVADRGAIEETFKDVKEGWGAGQQQVRNLHASVGCFNLNGWLYSLVEAWSWEQEAEELVDRRASPWDDVSRRPSHADRRKALQRRVLREEIEAVLGSRPSREEIRRLAERLLRVAG